LALEESKLAGNGTLGIPIVARTESPRLVLKRIASRFGRQGNSIRPRFCHVTGPCTAGICGIPASTVRQGDPRLAVPFGQFGGVKALAACLQHHGDVFMSYPSELRCKGIKTTNVLENNGRYYPGVHCSFFRMGAGHLIWRPYDLSLPGWISQTLSSSL
jgi:hypothetical protein